MSTLMSPEERAKWNEVSESFIEAVKEFLDEIQRKADEARAAFEKITEMCEEVEEKAARLKWERAGWRGAASLARSRMAARAQAFAVQMENQKARQAMKRRKLKHADGSFPDWECGCVR